MAYLCDSGSAQQGLCTTTQRQIDETDGQIDGLVYRLDGLSEAEIGKRPHLQWLFYVIADFPPPMLGEPLLFGRAKFHFIK